MLLRVDTGQDGNDGELVDALKMPALMKRSLISSMTGKLSFLSQNKSTFIPKLLFITHLSYLKSTEIVLLLS